MWKYEIFKFQILTSSAAPRPCLLLRHPIPVIRIQKPLARHSVLKISGETTFPTFRSKIVLKCVAVRVLPKFENFRLSHIKPLCVALISFKFSTFLTWYDCKQNVLKINTLTTHAQKLCRVTKIWRLTKTSEVVSLKWSVQPLSVHFMSWRIARFDSKNISYLLY